MTLVKREMQNKGLSSENTRCYLLACHNPNHEKEKTVNGPKRVYKAPTLIEYGPIGDHTFTTPGGVKGCQDNCHLDSFTERSSNGTS